MAPAFVSWRSERGDCAGRADVVSPRGGDAGPAPGRVGSVTRRRAGSRRSGGGFCRRRCGTDRSRVLGSVFAASQGVDGPLGGFGCSVRFDGLPAHEAPEPWCRISARQRLLHEVERLSCKHSGKTGRFCSFRSGGKGDLPTTLHPRGTPNPGTQGRQLAPPKEKGSRTLGPTP